MPPTTVADLTRLLSEALAALGRAGHAETANRIGGRAWSALRAAHPVEAERINALMHGLSKMESRQQTSKESHDASH